MELDGKKVADAKKAIRITITKSDVAKGKGKDPDHCAAALACIREGHASEARVHVSRVYLKRGSKWTRYKTPLAIRSEIISFDRGGGFAPGEYTLRPIQPSERYGAPRKKRYERTGKHPKRGRRVKPHVVAGIRSNANAGTGEPR